jgi:YNFM family putative membrane transporter
MTTPPAGSIASRIGADRAPTLALAIAILGAGLLVVSNVAAIYYIGLALLAAGSFFAQAIATGFVGRTATFERAAAGGLYLSVYYFGGLAGAAVVGALYDSFGWNMAVAENLLALTIAWRLAKGLVEPDRYYELARDPDNVASGLRDQVAGSKAATVFSVF